MENKKEEPTGDKEQKSLFDDSPLAERPTGKKAVAKQITKKTDNPSQEDKKRKWTLILLIIILIFLLGVLANQLFSLKMDLFKTEVTTTTGLTTTTLETTTTTTTKPVSESYLYVSEPAGLNLRSEASATAEILALMPFGSKLKKISEEGDWVKVVYEGKAGWCAKEFVTAEAPKELVYSNPDYGFQITFPADWEGYKLFPITDSEGETAAYYVALPTADPNLAAENGVDAGYSSLFAISIFTPDQWSAAATDPFRPTKVSENAKYIAGYSLPNGTVPTDLESQRKNAKTVAETLIFN